MQKFIDMLTLCKTYNNLIDSALSHNKNVEKFLIAKKYKTLLGRYNTVVVEFLLISLAIEKGAFRRHC